MKRSLLLSVLGVLFCGMFVVVNAMVDMDVEGCNTSQCEKKLLKNARISLDIKAMFDVDLKYVCTDPESAKKLFYDDRIKDYMTNLFFNEFVVTHVAKQDKHCFQAVAQSILDSPHISYMMINLFFVAAIKKSSIDVLKQIIAKGVNIDSKAIEEGLRYVIINKHYDIMILIMDNVKIQLKKVKTARWKAQKTICPDIKEFLDEWIDRREFNPF